MTWPVKQPTHVLGHTLDLIISRYSDNLLKAPLVTDFFVYPANIDCVSIRDCDRDVKGHLKFCKISDDF